MCGDGFDAVDYCASGADSDLGGSISLCINWEDEEFLTKRMSDVKWSSTALKAAFRLALSTFVSSAGLEVAMVAECVKERERVGFW